MDNINHPAHYTQGGIECIDAMVAAFGKEEVRAFCKVNAFKYLWRSEGKNKAEDIAKARWYLDKWLELWAFDTADVKLKPCTLCEHEYSDNAVCASCDQQTHDCFSPGGKLPHGMALGGFCGREERRGKA